MYLKLLLSLIFLLNISYGQTESVTIALESIPNFQTVIAGYESLYVPLGTLKLPDTTTVSNVWFNQFRPEFVKFVSDSKIQWDTTTRVWISFCCSPEGKIQKVLFKSRSISDQGKEKRFTEIVDEFSKNYTFPVVVSKQFSQCGSLKFESSK